MTALAEPTLPGMPEPSWSTPMLCRALGRNTNVVWRWLEVIGYPPATTHRRPPVLITEREAVAIYVGHLYGRTPLGRRVARAVAISEDPWLFVSLGRAARARTARELLAWWESAGTPTGVVVNVETVTRQLRQALETETRRD